MVQQINLNHPVLSLTFVSPTPWQGSGEGTRDSGPWEAFGVVLAQRGAALTPPPPPPQEKERQRLENLRRKEEAEQLRRQKVEEDKRRRLEEVKL